MSNGNLKAAEAWFRLLAEAARGTREARESIRNITEGGLAPQKLAENIARLLPAGVPRPSAETLNQWMEGVWATTGVVPRSRYLELLERYEALRARLEEAEVTIGRLKRLLSEKGHENDAQKILELLGSAVGETLKVQADWMRSWVPPLRPESEAETAEKPLSRKRARRKS